MITYRTTYAKGMNTRPAPNVNNVPNGTVAFGSVVEVLEAYKATADGVNVRTDDEWVKVSPTQWVAVRHMGVVYGVVEGVSTPPSEPIQNFPEYFILTDPQGKQARFDFTRILP